VTDYILIVDDDPDVIQLVRDVVETMDPIAIREAQDGQTALSLCAEARPAAIVLDLMLPVMDGFAVLDELQTMEQVKDVPIVVLSVLANDQMRRLREMPGVVGVMGKGDFQHARLRGLLEDALSA
jgi:CheY-like chemotaxis protein